MTVPRLVRTHLSIGLGVVAGLVFGLMLLLGLASHNPAYATHTCVSETDGNPNLAISHSTTIDLSDEEGIDGMSIETTIIDLQDGNDVVVRKRPGGSQEDPVAIISNDQLDVMSISVRIDFLPENTDDPDEDCLL